MSFYHATLVPQEVDGIIETINNYLSQFSENKPDSIVLDTYEWAVMDICMRMSSDNHASLHTHIWCNPDNHSVALIPKNEQCYCHRFVDDPVIREIVRDMSNYMDSQKNQPDREIKIYQIARMRLNNRFNTFFDGELDLDKNPNIALKIIEYTGIEMYRMYSPEK